MTVDIPASTPLTTGPAARRDSRLWLAPRGLAALFLVWLLSRWIFDAMWNLVPDEAYYWVWSRHLAASYLDHPPVVAYLIRLGTAILGNSELGVRCLGGLMTGGTVLVLTLAARRLTGDGRAAAFVPIALLVSPMVAVTGSIATPDAPACFFQATALAAALRIFGGGRHAALNWLAFGAFMGLALDSKYTSVLLGVAVLLALVSCSEGRRQLHTPWPWLAALVAAAVFSPVLFWNAQHQWASFRFQLHHGVVGGNSPAWKNLLDYAGGQAAICTPVMLGICVAGLIIYWRRKDNPMPVRILLLAATTPLVFFAISAVRRRPEVNWPMFAYFPAVMLYARYLGENWGESRRRPRRTWAEAAIIVALVFTVVLHAPQLVWKLSANLGSPQWDHLYGWRDLAEREVEPLRFDSTVCAADYEYASELSFYLPRRPEVRPLADPTRPTAFDFFDDESSPRTWPRVVLVRRLGKGYDAAPSWHPLGPNYAYSTLNDFSQYKDGRQIRRSLIEVAQRHAP
jgi:4-amino-4-deoxy-L-arabinose transferase-like glycosyltransferase